jgi:hypothetical protein
MARQSGPASERTHRFTFDAHDVQEPVGGPDAHRTPSIDQQPFPGGSSSR